MKKGLSAKDLINVGIYTAIYLVIFFVAGMMNAIPILYPAIDSVNNLSQIYFQPPAYHR